MLLMLQAEVLDSPAHCNVMNVKKQPVVFGATVCKTVRRMLSDRCLSVLSVCDVGVLWPNGWMDQDAISYGGCPRPGPDYGS